MTIETGIENAGVYIDSLDDTYPAGGDDLAEGDNHIRGIKNTLLNTFPAITGAVTSTHTELNLLDGATVTTAEINYNDITTLGTVQASKTVTANANGDIIFPESLGTHTVRFIDGGYSVDIYQDATGSLGFIDVSAASWAWYYAPSTQVTRFVSAINASGGITGNVTGNLTGNVTSTGTNSMHTLTVSNSFTSSALTATGVSNLSGTAIISGVTAGDTIIKRVSDYPVTTTVTSYPDITDYVENGTSKIRVCTAVANGTIRVTWAHYAGSNYSYARLSKNGVSVFAFGTLATAGAPQAQSQDVSVNVGDVLMLSHYTTGSSSNIIDITVKAASACLAVV